MSSGAQAEALAAEFLARRGLRIAARNVRFREGEIDLVCEHNGTLVFVEVRQRSRRDFGGALASVVRVKQQRLIRAALHYLSQLPRHQADRPCRFDVVAIDGTHNIEWIRDAFQADHR